MNLVKIFATTVICSLCFDYVLCIAPLIPIAIVGIGLGIGYLRSSTESCTDYYIPADLTLLKSSLNTEFHDQHLAREIVFNALESHIQNKQPKKSLALSFQGSSGTGKNHLLNLIINSFYSQGFGSKYVHYYNGHSDFSLGEKSSDQQSLRITQEVTNHLKSCERSIFVFDEVEHMPSGIVDAIMPFLDYNPRILKVNPTRAIFIFISNIGAVPMEEKLIKMWQAGINREETKLQDFKDILVNSAWSEESGFHSSHAIKYDFMDYIVPFLPFEKDHVKKCIIDAFLRRNDGVTPSSEMIQEVMEYLKFGPSPYNLYSKGGCKRVDSKVAAVIESQNYKKNPHRS